ncbi:MAG: aspartate--tRNA ligase [bacterium]|nr:aspartate--tRNA ligase [bacterium]
MKYRTHNCGELRKSDVDTQVVLAGWVDSIRDHGKVGFINLRDRTGITQIVVKDENLLKLMREIGHEWVISVSGIVSLRPNGMENPELLTGEIDVEADKIEVISKSKVTPFVIADEVKAKDELRLRYRYLDLRRYPMQRAIIFKSEVYQAIIEYLHNQGFVNIETPILGRSTPEGARDFIVPSRLHLGKFYSLTQSPQIYKQLLIIAGFDRYYQLAKCFRDEDQRRDRQLEFTQLDVELAFVDEEDVFELTEGLMEYIFKKVLNMHLHTPFKRMTYEEAIEKYGSEKPDTRYDLFLTDISEIAKKSEFRIFKEANTVKCIICEGDIPKKELNNFENIAKGYGMGLSWLKFIGGKFSGPVCKFFSEEVLGEFGLSKNSTVLIVAGESKRVSKALGGVRRELIDKQLLQKSGKYDFTWITDFPMFEYDKDTGRLVPSHHIFVMPKEPEVIENNPEAAIGKLYDLVLNGVELGTGSIRIHIRNLQEKVMEIIGLDKDRRVKEFGCLLEALEYGAPPHGGIALGLDRLIAIMLNIPSIQDVIAFPKTLTGVGLLEGIPSEVDEAQLKEVHVKIRNE